MAGFFTCSYHRLTCYFSLVLLVSIALPLRAQIDSLAEDLINEDGEQGNLVEWIETLSANPLDINNASEKEISELPFISASQIKAILKNRPFSRKSDIARLLGKTTYLEIRPFIIVKKAVHFPQLIITHRQQVTLEKMQAFKDHLFIGSPFETLTRLQVKMPGYISGGFLIQKDVGEKRFDDHFSGYIAWNPPEYPLKIIAGNFYIHSAEGLLFSGSYLPSKRSLIKRPVKIINCMLKPFLSANESDGFWGAAVQGKYKECFEITTFYSDNLRDAVLNDDTQAISRLEPTGYHRNVKELQAVNKARERSFGFVINIPLFKFSTIGLNFSNTSYTPGFETIRNLEEKKRDYFRYEGSNIRNYSLFYILQPRLFLLKGELVPLKNSSPAQQHSLYIGPIASSFLIRFSYLPTAHNSPHGRILSETQPFPRGVQQFLLGYTGSPASLLNLSLFWSVEKDLWRTYFNPMPVVKKSAEIYAAYSPLSGTKLSLKYYHTRDLVYLSNSAWHRIVDKLRLQMERKFGSRLQLRSRIEKVVVSNTSSAQSQNGFNFYQDLRLTFLRSLAFTIRFSSFYCKVYDARIYEFENGIPGIFSNYPLYGSGNKFYFYLTFSPFTGIKIWLKYRQINYEGVEQIGSGYTLIEGPMRQDLQFQIEYRY